MAASTIVTSAQLLEELAPLVGLLVGAQCMVLAISFVIRALWHP